MEILRQCMILRSVLSTTLIQHQHQWMLLRAIVERLPVVKASAMKGCFQMRTSAPSSAKRQGEKKLGASQAASRHPKHSWKQLQWRSGRFRRWSCKAKARSQEDAQGLWWRQGFEEDRQSARSHESKQGQKSCQVCQTSQACQDDPSTKTYKIN